MCRLPLAGFALFLSGCGPFAFSTELKGEAVVPGNAQGGALTTFPPLGGLTDLDLNTHPDFVAARVTRDEVLGVTVESASLKVLSPSDQDFTLLDSVQLVARSSDREVVVAQKLSVADLRLPAPNPVLTLDLMPGDLTPFVSSASMSLVLRGKGRQPLNDCRLQVDLKLHVSAK